MSKTLVGVQLVVLAKSKHLSHISDVQGTTAGVGVLGVMVRSTLQRAPAPCL